ncbi:hypothetical protein SLEP1_g3327 [Rubroshorea leprosula]|uniref:Uncharacterized protein n=1 Tax=Rubroshorea leprosula TaxID=152421 RepID=A0AAV5HR44_9ROSI|nr:hypothetical protein SLEP1_g3327 [Rubroshorea leprosula]
MFVLLGPNASVLGSKVALNWVFFQLWFSCIACPFLDSEINI